MKKLSYLIAIVLTINTTKIKAQDTDFQPGWYIIENGCQFSDGTTVGSEQETKELLSAGEVVFAYMKSGGVFYCISPSKEELFIRGTITPVNVNGKLGVLIEGVSLMDTDLAIDETFWVTNIDAGTGQATILLAGGQKQNIPSKSIAILSKYLPGMIQYYSFNQVAQ